MFACVNGKEVRGEVGGGGVDDRARTCDSLATAVNQSSTWLPEECSEQEASVVPGDPEQGASDGSSDVTAQPDVQLLQLQRRKSCETCVSMDTMEMNDTVYLDRDLVTEVDFYRRKPPSRCVTICLGLLCAVLLAENLGQIIFYQTISHPASEDPTRADRSALTREKDRVHDADAKRETLRGSYDAPAAEKEQLQITLSNLTEEKDRRRQSLGSPTAQRDEVETRHGDLRREKDQLQTGFNALREEMQQLQTNCSTLTSGRNRLQTGIDKLSRKIKGKPFLSQIRYLVHLFVPPSVSLSVVRGKLCPTRWRKFDAGCYFVSTAKKNWTESRRACVAEGADLVVVDGGEEQEFINGLLDVGQNAWMGLTDGLKEGEWTWVDGTPATTT
ncbi:C-type lectin domain family 4 member F-like [Brachyistius frenatus]|uniref:C-type lectin domain family 4 member F-like n=1 Tax=Brachyistius frenatus TaxID=100188 RepID=UPI0037E9C44F